MICQVYDNDSINDAQIKERFRQFKDSRVSMNSDPCFKIFNIENSRKRGTCAERVIRNQQKLSFNCES